MELPLRNQSTWNFIDAHVHIYESFNLVKFFSGAFDNIRKAAALLNSDITTKGVLYLAETKGSNWFDFLKQKAMSKAVDNEVLSVFEFATTLEPHSIEVRYPNHANIFIIASQQIVTAERLEVLALGTNTKVPDGLPVSEVLEKVQSLGALIVLPWGVGKWFGNRGKLINRIVGSQSSENYPIFLGDIAGRPRLWSLPSVFELAKSYGCKTLSGTDPLPLAAEATRAGAYGTFFKGEISSEKPAESLNEILKNSAITLQKYGQSENTYRFIRNQLSLRLQ
jgi:hypothetical protein